MDPDADGAPQRRSRKRIGASRKLAEDGQADAEKARQRLDRVRNALQLIWLRRALRERQRERDS
jgi:hypothetical protein